MRPLIAVVLLLVCCLASYAEPHNFHFAGPMTQFLAEGATPGAVTDGLPFAVVLSDAGATIAPTTFTLQGAGWDGQATLTLEDVKLANGHLTATVHLRNATDSALEGLRLDLTGASEEYKAKDDQGNDILKTRAQPVSIASPILFGDVAKRDDADPQPLDASTIAFQPETTNVTVSGVLSGLYYAGAIATPVEGGEPCSVDFDSQGRLYIALRGQLGVYRSDADGNNMTTVASFPDSLINPPQNIAVDPANGDILGTSHFIYRCGADGTYNGQVPPEGGPENDATRGFVGTIRFDRDGQLYCADEATLACYVDNQRIWTADHVGDHWFQSPIFFDVDGNGTFWVADFGPHELYALGRRGANGKIIATGPDWHLGRIMSPWAVRADAHGNIYVIEGESSEEGKDEVVRVSVFDSAGKIVRVFGHGDRTPAEGGELLEGQVSGLARDLEFGPDGRVYIANSNADAQIMVFRPF
jgi:DNA-binding beta-propeller fold protein YncE